MSIPDIWEKIKAWTEKEEFVHIIMALIVVLVGLAGFGLGKLSKDEVLPVKIIHASKDLNEDISKDYIGGPVGEKDVFASKNGTKYYFDWCGGVGNIKEENKITFSSEADAISAGYSKARGCK